MTTFTAEVGANHNGDFGRACALVDVAAAIGCTGVKFQYFVADRLYAVEATAQRRLVRTRQLPSEWLPLLSARAKANGLAFSCSVFDPVGAQTVAPHVDEIKISSYSMLDERLLEVVRELRKRLVLGTGMATLAEIDRSMRLLMRGGVPITLLHGVSGYPTPLDQCNLKAIPALAVRYEMPVGWSDHTGNAAVVALAALGFHASTVECHLDLDDGLGVESAYGHCWQPGALTDVIQLVQGGAVARGSGLKVPQPCEKEERAWRADPVDGLRPTLPQRALLSLAT